jgi:hypothetical protein
MGTATRTWVGAAGFGLVSACVASGCGSSDEENTPVGALCTPSAESESGFSGFNVADVSVETGSNECHGGTCLVNHFQGRRSCPYGQTRAELDSEPMCFLPGTNEPVIVPVEPQLTGRRGVDAVYCSCRCANAEGATDDGGAYCRCPSAFDCEFLVPDLGLGRPETTGAYCIKQGTKFNDLRLGTPCDRSADDCSE